MNTTHFIFCAIYPVIHEELHDAEQVVVWPPNDDESEDLDDDESEDLDAIAEAQTLIENATTLARVFVVQAPDDKAGADCLRSYFAQHDVVPHLLTVLEVDVPPHFLEPLQNKSEATCCYYLPFLFIMRILDANSIDALHQFCCDIVAEDRESS